MKTFEDWWREMDPDDCEAGETEDWCRKAWIAGQRELTKQHEIQIQQKLASSYYDSRKSRRDASDH